MQLCYGPMACLALFLLLTATGTKANKVHSCCTEVSRQKITVPIIGARLQEKNPPCVKAVIFKTKDGEFCSHWKEDWVRQIFIQLEKARKSLNKQNKQNTTTTSP